MAEALENSTPNPYESPSEANDVVVSSSSYRTLGRCLTYGGFATFALGGSAQLVVITPRAAFLTFVATGVGLLAFAAGIVILLVDAMRKILSVSRRSRNGLLTALLMASSLASVARAEDWPHWRGLNRDDVSSESSGWDGKEWRLKQLWKTNVGQGSTTPIVVAGRLYCVGWLKGHDRLQCLDLTTGKSLWTKTYECPLYGRNSEGDKGIYAGVCSTPEFDADTGNLYTLSIDGDLNA